MLPTSEQQIRDAFVNASRKETSLMHPPERLDELDWASLDFLGWRDQKFPRRAYAVIPTIDGDLVGVLFQQAQAAPRSRAQCSWCQDVQLPNDVVFLSAKRAGPAGRRGDTLGTLVCERFQCSKNVRTLPVLAYEGYDREAARDRRIDELQLRAAEFAEAITRR